MLRAAYAFGWLGEMEEGGVEAGSRGAGGLAELDSFDNVFNGAAILAGDGDRITGCDRRGGDKTLLAAGKKVLETDR